MIRNNEKLAYVCDFTIKTGVPDKEIGRYASRNGNIILTIHDGSNAGIDKIALTSGEKRTILKLKRDLSIPWITVNH